MKNFIRRYRDFRGCGYSRRASLKAAWIGLELNDIYLAFEDQEYH